MGYTGSKFGLHLRFNELRLFYSTYHAEFTARVLQYINRSDSLDQMRKWDLLFFMRRNSRDKVIGSYDKLR